MEWILPGHDFVCLCFCPLNHQLDVPCNDDTMVERDGHNICAPCARAMGILWSLDDVKRDIALRIQ
jgi:hypothetical protein